MSAVAAAHQHLQEALDELRQAAESGLASDPELLSVLTVSEGLSRQLEHLTVATTAALQRRGTFTDRGYRDTTGALTDLLGCDRFEAHRRVVAAEQACEQIGLDGTVLPARLPATAKAFAAGQAGLRHVEVIAGLLNTPAAGRLTDAQRGGLEEQLAALAGQYRPTQLRNLGTQLIEALDDDGPEPDDTPPAPVNTLHLRRNRSGSGGKITGQIDDAAMFDAIATVIDANSKPLGKDDQRPTAQRQAEALADACGYVLAHGEADTLPETGGRRPQLNVIIRLEDLEQRARSAMLDFGGTLTPESLRMLACDAAVVPIVMNGAGQPLDVGRSTRVIPDGLRRAVTARDRGCAHPGCDRPPAWCEIHHILEWEHDGHTVLCNLAMLCKAHHRLIHHSGWTVRMRDGRPEFIPPKWIDPQQRPRRNH
ncbi:HNH endonuclease signature motif containing protein [Pseudonocardia kunmingensis]|uniref:5-methylcytosine-specific restriction protein A n=1 Tax=Pseudonocardia kunmingensis TaxID=630975 RepID=A0A543DIX6_9PSEU|nr:HNH endonuclease signature motif containing protein [Pseudonocardia kunmingensis]TQM09280.1 5-methylcytosine-specific restriction protein A [Pseudonocardia kunmingensis]